MKNICVLILTLCFLASTSIHGQWTSLNSGTQKDLHGVTFINSQTGFMCGEDIILRTTNEGVSWDSISSSNGQTLKAIMFNGNSGYATGTFTFLGTSNGGASWRGIGNLPLLAYWCDLRFAGEDIFLLGGGGIFKYHTSTGELIAQYGDYRSIEKIFCFDSDTAFACGSEGKIYSSFNGGTNWQINSTPSSSHLKDIVFVTRDLGFSCGDGDILRTLDGGIEWHLIYSLPATQLRSLILNDGILYAFGDNGRILISSDSGENWELGFSPTSNNLYRSFAINSVIYIVGENGTLLRSDNLTSIQQTSTLPKGYWLGQNYPNPFNPTTKIDYSLPTYSKVRISIYDVSGREVEVLVDNNQSAGNHSIKFSGNNLSSGIYFYKLEADNFAEIKKMILIK